SWRGWVSEASCGRPTRRSLEAGLLFDDRRCVKAGAEVQLLSGGVAEHRLGIAADDDVAGTDNIAAISNRQRFAFAMVGQQNRDSAGPQVGDNVLDTVNRDRVDAGEGFVQQDD